MNNTTSVNTIDNYSLKGEWTYRFEDQEGNQVGDEISGTNIVTKAAYDTIFTNLGAAFDNTRRVFIGNMATDEKFNRTVVPSIAVGTLENYVYTPRAGNINPYGDWEGRINFTGSRRVFRSLGLCTETSPITARLTIGSTITVTAVSGSTITVSLGTTQIVRNTNTSTGINDCWVTKDAALGEPGFQILSINDSATTRTSFTITFTENVGTYFQVGNVVRIINTLNTALAYSKIQPLKYNITLASISGNALTFTTAGGLAFSTNSLASQYISPNINNDFGTVIQASNIVQTSDTNLTLTINAGDLGSFAIGNNYFLTIYPVQESNITLFVKYRITVIWANSTGNTFPDFRYSLENRIFSVGSAINLSHASYGYGKVSTIPDVTDKLSNRNAYTPTHTITSTTFNNPHMYKRVFPSPNTDGTLYNYIMLGNDPNTEQAIWYKGVENTRSPIQNQFPHSAIATIPFYSSTAENLPGGSLKPIVSGTWTEWLPHMYDFVITAPGLVGISTYKIKQYLHTGTQGNTFNSNIANVPSVPIFSNLNSNLPQGRTVNRALASFNTGNPATGTINIIPESQLPEWLYTTQGTRIPFGKFGFLQCGADRFSIITDCYLGTIYNYSATNYPILNNLNITQVCIFYYGDPENIWIACRNNGLYKLDFSTQTISLVVNEPCYGVSNKTNGEIVALFNSGFRTSQNNFSTVLGDANTINKSEVKFIHVDKKELLTTRVICFAKDIIDNLRDVWYFWTSTAGLLERVTSLRTTAGNAVNVRGAGFTNQWPASNNFADCYNGQYRGVHSNSRFNSWYYDVDTGVFLGFTWAALSEYGTSREYLAFKFNSSSTYIKSIFQVSGGSIPRWQTVKGASLTNIVQTFKNYAVANTDIYKVTDLNTVSPTLSFISTVADTTGVDTDAYSNSCILYNTYDINDNRLAYISENILMSPQVNLRLNLTTNTYGWNSTTGQWKLDNNNLLPGKPTHSTAQPIIDGLSIAWSELSPEQPYAMSTGEYFNCFVNHGMFKDPYITNPTYTFYFTMRPTVQFVVNTVIGAGLTYQLPFVSSDALFGYVLLDGTDTKLLHNVSISGYGGTVQSITVGTTAATANTIAINSEKGGLITFNAADVGKTFSGTITYTRKYHSTEVT
jgi:hypothetical protein